ncbi:exosortase A [Kiritimatiella glycovorans]|uniref:Exosortase A n=1 Tax=Kiritimatiella glycovorans TaxID=1307763 RepID=A0A0G3EFH7_9BACT|nr:exosortase A [Kiritimatiella glycovorans]
MECFKGVFGDVSNGHTLSTGLPGGAAPGIWSERWRLAAIPREEMLRLLFVSVMVGLLYVMFHFLGNTVENVQSRSAFQWMFARWRDKISFGADYSHGYLIPFVSLGVLWYKRRELFAATRRINYLGLGVVVMALAMHWLGAKMQQTRISLMSLILLLWGIPFYLLGWQTAKLLIFPCAYLIFCIPLNFLDTLAFPLRMFASTTSAQFLNSIGIAAVQRGSAIFSGASGFEFDVADPCSGLRSLLAMTALTAVYAYFTQKTLLKKWLLFLCSIPLAVFGNVARITTIAMMAEAFGQQVALGIYHDYSGYILFAAAIALMVALGSLFNMNYREQFEKWKSSLFART